MGLWRAVNLAAFTVVWANHLPCSNRVSHSPVGFFEVRPFVVHLVFGSVHRFALWRLAPLPVVLSVTVGVHMANSPNLSAVAHLAPSKVTIRHSRVRVVFRKRLIFAAHDADFVCHI